jgi:4-hydroxybenzoate polyprenyltransferase/phosphoserine phosphatase
MTDTSTKGTDQVGSTTQPALVPLYVDLDHTLVRTDIAQEMLIRACRQPNTLWSAARAHLAQGPAALKARLAQEVEIAVEHLPYNQAVLEHIKQARESGRRVVLATAADHDVADRVAEHLGLFDHVLASCADHNMKSQAKLAAIEADLRAHGNTEGFEYLGDSRADLPIWQTASLRGFAAVPQRADHWQAEATLWPTQGARSLRDYLPALKRAMRPHQWAKNVLLFVPLLFAHLYSDAASVALALLGFVAFSLCASSIYLINDLLDVEADRAHATKRSRPFAAGDMPPAFGVGAALALLVLSLTLAACLSGPFLAVMLAYVALTNAYSLWLKQFSTIDVVILALLYTVRIIAGAAAIAVLPSPWLLTFSLFFFLSLAYMKRYIELSRLVAKLQGDTDPLTDRLPVRNYYAGDLTIVQIFGIANGALSLLTLAEYVSSEMVQKHYLTPGFLWLMLPVMMFWTYRAWMWANRDQIGDDPVAFALRDRISHIAVLVLLLIVALARYVDLGLQDLSMRALG